MVTCIPCESEEKFAVLRQIKSFLLNAAGKVSDLSCKRDHSQAQGAVVLIFIGIIVITGSRKKMFIAMNRFQVTKGREADFEILWKSRDSRLNEMNGFVVFHLLRGPELEDHTLYSSHTVWASKQDFEDWTQSEQFREAHKNAGKHEGLYLGHPNFEGFDVVQTLK